MALYALGGVAPTIHPEAFVHPDATVIGDVTLGEDATVWPRAVLRGDYGPIEVGARTSIQDGSVIHATRELPTYIGSDCVVGHLVHIECCVVEDGALVGSGSIVLHRCRVGTGAIVAAAALVPNDTHVPPRAMALGVPATIRPERADQELITRTVANYVDNGRRYRRELRRMD